MSARWHARTNLTPSMIRPIWLYERQIVRTTPETVLILLIVNIHGFVILFLSNRRRHSSTSGLTSTRVISSKIPGFLIQPWSHRFIHKSVEKFSTNEITVLFINSVMKTPVLGLNQTFRNIPSGINISNFRRFESFLYRFWNF